MGSWEQCDGWLSHQGGREIFFLKAEEEWPGKFILLSEIPPPNFSSLYFISPPSTADHFQSLSFTIVLGP